ncbi:Uncharacterized protein FWK35_00028813 [Aphis craccivora]|uniref:Uncharacterized protein n=1 Tax=Aphis craccivora TaxID=307492 RepID=A0A6G0Y136_APHCR|nr:Uncharacterized protein FWK35_00028813 [Aphis craccivora]
MAFPREPHILFFVTSLRSWKRGYTPGGRHFWGFPLFRPALLEISTLSPAGRKKDALNASTVFENQTFGAGVTKNI